MRGRAVSPLIIGFALAGCAEEEPQANFFIGMQPDCTYQEIDNFFEAPIDEGNGIVSWIDSRTGLGDDGGDPFSDLIIGSCLDQSWIKANWNEPEAALRLLEALRASNEQMTAMIDEVEASDPVSMSSGSHFEDLGYPGSVVCGCDIYYKTDFGQYGASHQ
jgi:hypothetical protein